MSEAQEAPMNVPATPRPTNPLRLNLNGLLFSMLASGILIVIVFGFYIDTDTLTSSVKSLIAWGLLHPARPSGQVGHWRLWELGAVLWSFFFGVYSYPTCPIEK